MQYAIDNCEKIWNDNSEINDNCKRSSPPLLFYKNKIAPGGNQKKNRMQREKEVGESSV